MNIVVFTCLTVVWWIIITKKILSYLHIIQIEGYKPEKFEKWISKNEDKIYSKSNILLMNFTMFLALVFMLFYRLYYTNIFVLLSYFILFFISFIRLAKNQVKQKKPFKYTKRAKRLVFISQLVVFLFYLIAILPVIFIYDDYSNYFSLCASCMGIIYFFSSKLSVFSFALSIPLENKINKKFYNMAYKRIREIENLKIVGITGSYGKTSTKFITSTLLEKQFNILKTPESYNTPMGLSKVINNDLSEKHEIFIAELGATKIGDIMEVAELTNPKIAVITSIGPCHLESFKSIENIKKTKYELVEYIPDDGIAIFNYDDVYVKEMANITKKKKILYGTENIDELDVYATEISVDERGSKFILNVRNIGSIECRTNLLGRHNILNILAGVSVAICFDISLYDIEEGIGRIMSVQHRLQLIDPHTGVLVIDDAFNSNPEGAASALNVLSQFENRRKIIITPGMVELGKAEYEENYKFGEKIADICDIVVLVGKKRTKAIYDGILNKQFQQENIYFSYSPQDTDSLIKSITKPGDVILFENDLPDSYNEI